ncbi:MAG TPA: TIGR03619 family F420-dependent LLM class oxidoreductase [Mycobacteriales bacterium]|jgi:probable F420-dependent oxidoreductase|nr:TIGR03619 family F420-dependent LLM class oxidoreductase [Mycobacteriales bacterium]
MTGTTLSVGIPNFGGWAGGDWRALLDVARACDDSRVHRLIVNDHVVMGRRTNAYLWGRFPTAPDGPWLEPLSVLSAMAAVTRRVRLATGVVIAPLRPAAVLAKTVATLDVLSGGRVDLGVGTGWQAEEYDALGLDFADRGQRLDDTIGACRALWSDLPASFSSETVSFEDTFCSPQPVQHRLPVWFAGALTDHNLQRIVELGDGWIPIMGASIDDIRAGADRLRSAAPRPIPVQAPATPVKRADGSRDPAATMAGVPDLMAAGASDIYVNIASFASSPAAAPSALDDLVTAFSEVTQ